MNRYFYSVEMDGDRKVIHMSGNIYFNDVDETETCYRAAEWTGLYIPVKELAELINSFQFYDYINERVAYLTDLTEEQAVNICKIYFCGTPGIRMHVSCVDENTPCGDYWFE